MHRSELERQIAAIASLHEPVRRGLYLYVARRRRDVGRDEAARALRISRALAAFHLDKLVRQGLLETSYRRLTGRRGPGAGRPAKLYRRSAHQLDLTLPRRRYELAGRMLAQALTEARSPAAVRALRRVARDVGRGLGADARRGRRGAGTSRGPLARLLGVLEWCGFEPARSNGSVHLANCPFAALANQSRALVCGMNLALLEGVLQGVQARGMRAVLDPQPPSCCVVLRSAGRRYSPSESGR